MALGEALTNMAGVVIKGLDHVQVSANWMAASGDPEQDSALRNGVEALSKISVDLEVVSVPTWENISGEIEDRVSLIRPLLKPPSRDIIMSSLPKSFSQNK